MDYNACIYPVEPWTITETEFDMKDVYRNETTFALSNGYIGTRGTFEESYPFPVEEGLEGNFINGFYESEDIRYGEWNFGFPLTSQSLLNLPNCKTLKLEICDENMMARATDKKGDTDSDSKIEQSGEILDLREGTILDYSRKLHMDQGVVERTLTWKSPRGKIVKVHSRRFTSFAHKNLMAISYKVTPINFTGVVKIYSELDANVENHTRKTNPLVDYGPFGKRLFTDKLTNQDGVQFYQGTTKHSHLTMACGSTCDVKIIKNQEAPCQKHDEMENSISEKKIEECTTCNITDLENDKTVTIYSGNVSEGETLEVEKYIVYTSELDMESEKLAHFVRESLEEHRGTGYQSLEERQRRDMADFWDNADVMIRGDDALQQGIRFNLFHIMQAAGRDGKTGMGAKGLSGEGYEGHYFWDTEMYVLPVFAYTSPELAKSLLDYRYEKLEDARERAKVLGHEKGALYPWRTINGKEASTYYPLGTAQYHINADIAYAFKLYVDVADDYDYLEKRAAEVLIETARVWADVGCFAESKGNKYCICAVTGPDEYNAIVDNNFYTNLMARENIKDAIWALDRIRDRNPQACHALIEKLAITEEEVSYWHRIVENMYFPFDEKRQVYPGDDGFMQRKPWDETKIPVEKRHLLYENYHPLFIFRQRMSKQADAILGMLLHSNYFTEEELRRNYDFYQEVTLHHSSLSTCIFGILASQIGYEEEAYRYFSQSARMDLDDYHNNFYAGIHAANMAGTWQGIVLGFAGLRTNKGVLEFKPSIPEQWEGYSFKLNYKGAKLKVAFGREKCTVTLLNDTSVIFYVGETEYPLDKDMREKKICIDEQKEKKV
ncbi:MAG: glycosyl hydrolase family 65 protein [Lachnospiraceae bacterium]|nr:glycosyl hydrolase family 65 protein [Lachnospiraceae bacterium]